MNSRFALIGVDLETMVVDTVSTVCIKNASYIRGLKQLCVVVTKTQAKDLWLHKITLDKLVKFNPVNKGIYPESP